MGRIINFTECYDCPRYENLHCKETNRSMTPEDADWIPDWCPLPDAVTDEPPSEKIKNKSHYLSAPEKIVLMRLIQKEADLHTKSEFYHCTLEDLVEDNPPPGFLPKHLENVKLGFNTKQAAEQIDFTARCNFWLKFRTETLFKRFDTVVGG